MNSYDDEVRRTEELLARALSDEADEVDPKPGALQQIQRRTARTFRSRTPWLMGALGAAVATAAVITAVVVIGDTNDAASNGTPAATQPTTDTTTPTRTPVEQTGMHQGVYDPQADSKSQVRMAYFGPRPGNPEGPGPGDPAELSLLFTETHTVTATDESPLLVAPHEFLTSTPIDPDYRSGWPEGVDISGVVEEPGLTTYELEGSADITSAGRLTPGEAETAVQAFILTSGADSTAALTYNGEPVTTLLGVDVSKPVAMKSDVEIRARITIDNISEGQTVSSPVAVKVSGMTFEANLIWQLLDADGRTLAEDFGMVVGSYGEWKQADIDLGDLEPGTYTFKAFENDAADGGVINVDDKTFTVS